MPVNCLDVGVAVLVVSRKRTQKVERDGAALVLTQASGGSNATGLEPYVTLIRHEAPIQDCGSTMQKSDDYAATVESFTFRDLAEELGSLSSALSSGLLSEDEKKEYSRKKLIVMTEISKRMPR